MIIRNPRPAAVTWFTASVATDGTGACPDLAGLTVSFGYARHVIRVGERRRRVERRIVAWEIICAGGEGARYRLVGSARTTNSRMSGVVWRMDGVLVGAGPLNNRPLSVAIRVDEERVESVRADIVSIDLA